MRTKYKVWGLGLGLFIAVMLLLLFLPGRSVPVLQPSGVIGEQEHRLIIIGVFLSVIIVIPVYALLFGIAWRYREGNKKVKRSPDWDHNRALELTWWAIPGVIITILSVVAWQSSHRLDPYRPLASTAKPVTIQVIALDWKWLFIYPEEHIASVNFVELPVNTPVTFTITADAPMNSFWIPALGSQIYAMPGMSTQLHLEASKIGDYKGSSANISGEGFADMKFTARAASASDFKTWVQAAQGTGSELDLSTYTALAKPSKNNPEALYGRVDSSLYDTVVMKYMTPTARADGGSL